MSVRSLIVASAVLWLAVTVAPAARACTEDTLLDLIGGIEAPGGYDTVWQGVRLLPPRPVSAMTVGEVIDWQREAMRTGSASTAAGRYQIIRPTLEALVRNGAVPRGEIFDAGTQDRLARHLLRETGYRDGVRSEDVAETIAQVWASLPRITGTGAGRSVYAGIAGNHALIDADTFRGVLDCTIGVDEALRRAGLVRAGQRFGITWDRFLEDLVGAARSAMAGTARLGIGMVLALFLVDLVWRGGQWLMAARSPGRYFESLVYRLFVVLLCIALLMEPTAVTDLIGSAARRIAGGDAGGGGLTLADHAAGRMALTVSLLEGVTLQLVWVRGFLFLTSVAIAFLTALQIALIVFWNFRLLLAGIGGLLAVGFGGLSQTAHIPGRWIRTLLATGMALLTALLVIEAFAGLAWEARATLEPMQAAAPILLLETVTAILLWVLPGAVHRSVRM